MTSLKRPTINRERLLINIALILGAFFLLDFLLSLYTETKEQLLETRTHVSRLELMTKRPQNWEELKENAFQKASSLEEMFADSDSRDLAQANVQSWLQATIEKTPDVRSPEVDVTISPELHPLNNNTHYWKIQAAIRGRSNPSTALALLRNIEESESWSVMIHNTIFEKKRFMFTLSLITLKRES